MGQKGVFFKGLKLSAGTRWERASMQLIKTGLLITIIVLGYGVNILAAPPLLNVVTEEFPPYNYTDDGKIKGISTTVVTETLKRSGLKYRLRALPWRSAYKKIALKEKNVLIYSIYRSAERETLFAAWVGPILPPAAVYFYKLRARTDIKVASLDEARRYKIGVTRDDINHELLKKLNFPRLEIAGDALSNTRNILSRRVDLIPSYALSLAARLRQMGEPFHVVQNTIILVPTETSKLYMALSRGTSPEIIAQIKTAFAKAQAERVIDRAVNEYLEGIR